MIVQSFRKQTQSHEDFLAFGRCLNTTLAAEKLIEVAGHTEPKLYLGWVTCDVANDQEIARAIV